MKLFLVHCGFYHDEIGQNLYEMHDNFYVVAADFAEARAKAKANPLYKKRKMHVDGLQEIEAVDGFRVSLREDKSLAGGSVLKSSRQRPFARKPAADEA